MNRDLFQDHEENMKYWDFTQDISPTGRLLDVVLQETSPDHMIKLRQFQLEDKKWGPILKCLIEKKKSDYQNYAVKKGILIYINKNFNNTGNTVYQICVPARIAPKLIQHFHKNVFFQHMASDISSGISKSLSTVHFPFS